MQFQADVLGVPVIRPAVTETTALGAAFAAGLAVGFWSGTDELRERWEEDKRWEPAMDEDEREKQYGQWKKAVERTFDWVEWAPADERVAWCHGDRVMVDGHGRGAGPRGQRPPRCRPLPRRAARARAAVPAAHQQLDLHPARPGGAAAGERARRAGGADLDLGLGDRPLPRNAAAGRHRLRRRRVGDLDPALPGRLHADRPRTGLRGARRDPHLQLRADHPGDPADRRRRPLHRHQPRPDRALARAARCRRPARWRR